MRKMIVLAAAMTLMSCSGGGETVAPADNQAAPETGAAAQVAKLDEEQRNGVLERAIRASGAPCPAVTGSERTEVRHGGERMESAMQRQQCAPDRDIE